MWENVHMKKSIHKNLKKNQQKQPHNEKYLEKYREKSGKITNKNIQSNSTQMIFTGKKKRKQIKTTLVVGDIMTNISLRKI